ncbi:MAG: DNA internalization-related competence protein ComEC/Rec2 [Defluviitaleaceae bacterium]|nr:DNA internalization-related competence protein ComEC/Rec2 [Defluviitaleaceae bacterium]
MIGAAAALILGIIGGFYFAGGAIIPIILGLAAIGMAVGFYAAFRRRVAFVLPVFVILGFLMVGRSLAPTDYRLDYVAARGGFVRIDGVVEDIGLTRRGNQRVTLLARSFAIGPGGEIVESPVRVRVFLPEWAADVDLGRRIVVSGLLMPPDPPLNPGGFDELRHMRARGIEYKLFAETLRIYGSYPRLSLQIRQFGLNLADIFDKTLSETHAGIMRAMIVGDRSGLDREVVSIFRSVGIYHILVVSGLHLNILSKAFEKLLQKIGIGQRPAGLATIGFIAGYTVLTGAGIATLRAAIMGIVLIIARLARRDYSTIAALALAAVILLAIQPLFLFEIGFIYSFGMVAALSLGHAPMERVLARLRPRIPRARLFFDNWYTKKYLPYAMAAMLAHIPINSFFFYTIAPFAWISNFLLVPSVAIVLILGFLMAIFGLFGTIIPGILALPIGLMLDIYEFVSRGIAAMPFTLLLTGRPRIPVMAVFIAAPLLFIYHMRKTGTVFIMRKARNFGICAVLVLIITNIWNTNLYLTFLYVGQGDGAVIHRRGNAVIIDGGGVFGREIGENTGVFTLLPYLDYRGIRRASAIVTHNHSDHAIGVIEAMLAGRVSHLFLSAAEYNPGDVIFDLLIYAALYSRTPVTFLQTGDFISKMNMRLYVIYPPADIAWHGNNASLVLRLVYGQNTVLFTGDIEAEAEAMILQSGADIGVCVLSVAHHGSRTSSAPAFLAAASPDLAVISAGRRNMFNHPHPSTMRNLRDFGIPYAITAERGAVLLRLNGRYIQKRTMR